MIYNSYSSITPNEIIPRIREESHEGMDLHFGYYLEIDLYSPIMINPNAPTITSPNGFEFIEDSFFTITWDTAVPTDDDQENPDDDDQENPDTVLYYQVEYTTDSSAPTPTWISIDDELRVEAADLTPDEVVSLFWDLGTVPDTTDAKVRIRAVDLWGLPGPWDESDFPFEINEGGCVF